jgi:hypothetical protein
MTTKLPIPRVVRATAILLFFGCGASWLGSYARTSTWSFNWNPDTSYFLSSHRGRFEIAVQRALPITPQASIVGYTVTGRQDVTTLGEYRTSGKVSHTVETPAGFTTTNWSTCSFNPHSLHDGFMGFGRLRTDFISVTAIPHWFLILIIGMGCRLFSPRTLRADFTLAFSAAERAAAFMWQASHQIAISLLITVAIASATAGVASYLRTGTLSWERNDSESYFLTCHQGRLELSRQCDPHDPGAKYWVSEYGHAGFGISDANGSSDGMIIFDPHKFDHSFMGFGWARDRMIQMVGIPLWFPAIVSAGITASLLHRHNRLRNRQRTGLCPICGYDLRATPDRCPECGTVPADQVQNERRDAETQRRKNAIQELGS